MNYLLWNRDGQCIDIIMILRPQFYNYCHIIFTLLGVPASAFSLSPPFLLSIPHPYYPVWESPFWLHLWCWTAGLHQHVHCPQSDEHEERVCGMCGQCPWLLPTAHGVPLMFLPHSFAAVSLYVYVL